MPGSWPVGEVITTSRLVLEPLRVQHADEMAAVLDDGSLHEFIEGRPATLEQLRDRYARQAVGESPDGTQGWLNWIIRLGYAGSAVGTVQATLHREADGLVADLAWVVGTAYQGQGYAREAAAGMVDWLNGAGVEVFVAYLHPAHHASARVAQRLELRRTDVVVDGEVRWIRKVRPGGTM